MNTNKSDELIKEIIERYEEQDHVTEHDIPHSLSALDKPVLLFIIANLLKSH